MISCWPPRLDNSKPRELWAICINYRRPQMDYWSYWWSHHALENQILVRTVLMLEDLDKGYYIFACEAVGTPLPGPHWRIHMLSLPHSGRAEQNAKKRIQAFSDFYSHHFNMGTYPADILPIGKDGEIATRYY